MTLDPTPTPTPARQSDRIILRVEADSTDEELDLMSDALVGWIQETWARHYPGTEFFS